MRRLPFVTVRSVLTSTFKFKLLYSFIYRSNLSRFHCPFQLLPSATMVVEDGSSLRFPPLPVPARSLAFSLDKNSSKWLSKGPSYLQSARTCCCDSHDLLRSTPATHGRLRHHDDEDKRRPEHPASFESVAGARLADFVGEHEVRSWIFQEGALFSILRPQEATAPSKERGRRERPCTSASWPVPRPRPRRVGACRRFGACATCSVLVVRIPQLD